MTHMRLICLIASVCFAFYTMAEQNDDEIVLHNYDIHKNAPSRAHPRIKRQWGFWTVSCSSNEFQCDSGACIHEHKLCNGVPECKDGSDEKGCEKRECPGDYWKCANKIQCIKAAHKCDGDSHCSDGSDEWNCEDFTATAL